MSFAIIMNDALWHKIFMNQWFEKATLTEVVVKKSLFLLSFLPQIVVKSQ